MRFFAILSDSLRVFASFTYREYTRASPNTLFPILADHRRVSLILLYFMRFFAILSDSLRVFASFTYCEYTRASPNTLFPIIADYRRDSLILFYFMSGYLVFLLGHPLCYPHTSATLPL